MYWQWREPRQVWRIGMHVFTEFLHTEQYKQFKLINVSRPRYNAGRPDVFPEIRDKWSAGEPVVSYIITRYVDAMREAIEDPKSYSNGPSHEPVSPLYFISCTAECLHLLAVSEQMIADLGDEECVQVYLRELDIPSRKDKAKRWLLKHALAQLTGYNYGDALPVVGPSLKFDLDRVKSRLRHIMALPELGPEEAYLSETGSHTRYTCTDPGCWSYMHEANCEGGTTFLFNPHWQIMVYNVMLPRLLDEMQSFMHGTSGDALTIARATNIDRFITCVQSYRIQRTTHDNILQQSLLYNFHLWPKRSPLVFSIAGHPSDSAYILNNICFELEQRNVAIYAMAREKDKCTLLHVAAASGNYDTVKHILDIYTNRDYALGRGGHYWYDKVNSTNARTRKNAPTAKDLGETPRDVVENRLYNLVMQRDLETKVLSADETRHLEERLSKVDALLASVQAENNPATPYGITRHKIEQVVKDAQANPELLKAQGVNVDDMLSKARRLLALLADDGGQWLKVRSRK
jgi:hypothetical protein